jgi:hypothetical protein
MRKGCSSPACSAASLAESHPTQATAPLRGIKSVGLAVSAKRQHLPLSGSEELGETSPRLHEALPVCIGRY